MTFDVPQSMPWITDDEVQAVTEVLCDPSGRISMGPRQNEFEELFRANIPGAGPCRAVSSGTAGLHLAVRAAMERQEGSLPERPEVITTPLTFVATANALLYENVRPVFCDIDERTLNIDPARIAEKLTPNTVGICPVHIFGYPAAMPAIEKVARSHPERELWIVEDACQALGARHGDGRCVGARGNFAAFAFYANKQMTTGEGGMVACPDSASAEAVDSMRNQGRVLGTTEIDHDRVGFNYRLSEIACALGTAQLRRLREILDARATRARWYREALVDVPGVTLPAEDADGDERSWFVFVVQLDGEERRRRVNGELRERGIESKEYLPAIHRFPQFESHVAADPALDVPVAEDVAARSVALPFFPTMTEGQIDRVVTTLRRVLSEVPA